MIKMTTTLKFLVVALLLNLRTVVGDGNCPNSLLAFPEQFAAELRAGTGVEPIPNRFPFLEAGLQIFLHLEIPCDGKVTEFKFWSAKTTVNGLHLGIFRINLTDNSAELISDSYVNNYKSEITTAAEGWITWQPTAPIEVQHGYVLGLFYDELEGDISVRSLTLSPDEENTLETLVFLSPAKQLTDEWQGRASFAYGYYVQRAPAFYVTLQGSAVDSATMMSSTDESTSESETNATLSESDQQLCNQRPAQHHLLSSLVCPTEISVRYYYHSSTRFCREFIHCPNEEPKFGGFSSYKECMKCRKPIGANIAA